MTFGSKCFLLCLVLRKGFLLATLPMKLWLWKWRLMVLFETWWPQDATKACNSFTVILGDFVASHTIFLSILGGKMQLHPLPMSFQQFHIFELLYNCSDSAQWYIQSFANFLVAITTFTVMVKNIGSPALLSDNAPLPPENCCNYKCFGIHMFIYFVCIGKTQTNLIKKPNLLSFHTELQK